MSNRKSSSSFVLVLLLGSFFSRTMDEDEIEDDSSIS
jgi:hypothetical protein